MSSDKKKDFLEFQIYDYREENVFEKEDDMSDSEMENVLPKYIIHTFGKTMEGKSVYCKITDYTPYFFIELPEDWDKKEAKRNVKYMKEYLMSKYNNKVFPKKYKDGLIDIKLVEKMKPTGFTNGKKFLFALLVFNNEISRKKFAAIFNPYDNHVCEKCSKKNIEGLSSKKKEKFELVKFKCNNCEHEWDKRIYPHGITIMKISSKPIHYPIYESNFPAFLRCFHIKGIKGCGWIRINSKDANIPCGLESFQDYDDVMNASNQDTMELDDCKESMCHYEMTIHWNKIESIEKENNAPFVIASFDIECDSVDGQFPQAKRNGDKIIQIGTTYTRIGESEPFRQHIVCLNKTSNVEGAIVESYSTEKDLVRGWLNEIHQSDCDIITGWNIFYFDEKYIYDRCENILGFDNINYISKLKEYHCNFKEMKLASSAMGENLLRFWETPGRVHVDLMKDVQNNFNLTSYRLDSVSAEFIRGAIEEIVPMDNNKYMLKCASVKDIHDDDFIHIELLKSFVSDFVGSKYQVIELDTKNKTIMIQTNFDIIRELEILGKGKLFWSQAKDDVGPKDIFRLQKGSPDDRAIVAKYCVKDCRLVNLLINKLEVITRSIEMANVCYIPMYFLFTRGQGIKLFSLCSKYYREAGFVFPVLKKPIVNPGSYEGAIVFDPIPSATYEALCTKDYASLYPSSILHKNMSHETKIVDEKYDNLPDVEYYNAKFVDNDGSIQYRRFAKVDKTYGVIPTILDTLLKERKAVKKQMKVEKDPFRASILDGKQLALKITANSLYGQLGAGTSPVRDRDIAACTTSTGREMLIFAKKYDEEYLPYIMNGLKYARMNNDSLTFNKILEQEIKNFPNNQLALDINVYLDSMEDKLSLPVIKYGDSVIGDTPLLLKNKETNMIQYIKIKDLTNNWSNYHNGKESSEMSKYMTWTETGWKDIKRVIRHKLSHNKKLLQIKTKYGIVVVTDEHSLLDSYGNMIDASKIKEGQELLHHHYGDKSLEYTGDDLIFEDSVIALKNFHTLTSIGYDIMIEYVNNKYILKNNNYDMSNTVYSITEWKYSEEYVYDLTTEDHHFQAGVGCMIVHNTDSVFTCFRYRDEVNSIDDKTSLKLFKKIIKFGSQLMLEFIPYDYVDIWKKGFKKYYSTSKIKSLTLPEGPDVPPQPDHWKTILPIETRILQFMKEYMELMYFPWLWTLQDLFLKEYNDLTYLKSKQYEEILQVKIFRKANSLIEMMRIAPDEYSEGKREVVVNLIKSFVDNVLMDNWMQPYWKYNSKTDKFDYNMKFYNGGNKMIDKRCLELSMELGMISGELVKSRLPPPHDLEYEKTFWPFIILTKKRYVGNKYEFDKSKYKMNYMGIVLKRRDNAPIVKEVCDGIITRLLNDKSPSMAKKFTKQCMKDMFAGKYDIKYFLTSKTLKMKESYKDWTRIAHVVLAERIGKRDPGNKPQSGDRIEYAAVCIENETKDTLQGDRIETPKYIKEQNLDIDYLFYMTNQIRNPATQFLELVIKDPEEIFDRFRVKAENKKKGQVDILNFVTRTRTKKNDSDELSSISPMEDVTDMFKKRVKNKKEIVNLDV